MSNLWDSVAGLNAYLATKRIEGFAFAGLRRIFSNGDQPGFDWQWGGRFYSLPEGDSYELWKGGTQVRIATIRIEGEPVAEVDISACHLTILYGLRGVPFDPDKDPYDIPGIARAKVKRWLTFALGKGTSEPIGSWYARVREATLEAHPILRDLATYGKSSLDLQYHESEILLSSLVALMDHDVPTLPIHDGLIVPASKETEAKDALRVAFGRYFRDRLGMNVDITPRVP